MAEPTGVNSCGEAFTDPEDRYNTLKKNLSRNSGDPRTTGDLKIIERGLAEVDLTPEQRAQLLETAASTEEPK